MVINMKAKDTMPEKLFTYVDLFCGAGGLSLGFEKNGFKCIQAIDKNAYAVNSFKKNISQNAEVNEIYPDILVKESDIIIGGPPCQGFSSAGLRKVNDKRNSLVSIFSKIVQKTKPKAFLFENVEGFLTAEKGKRLLELLGPLLEAGYNIQFKKINCANYGVPQLRKRVIVIGGFEWYPSFPVPTHRAFGAPGASKKYKKLPNCPNIIDAIYSLPEPANTPPGNPEGHFKKNVSKIDLERINLLVEGQRMKDLPEELWHDSYKKRAYRRVKDGTPTEKRGGPPAGLRRLVANQPSKAITSGAIWEFIHPNEDRFLTPRECARIQTFPDDFRFEGSPTQQILQIGNAVPPKLAESVAKSLKNDLTNLSNRRNSRKNGLLLSFVPTNTNAMSPALLNVYKKVKSNFNLTVNTNNQISIWN
jgi:DNA (cytosine-5)-methyltransferase 1